MCKLGVITAFIIFTAINQAANNDAPEMNLLAVIPFFMLSSNLVLYVLSADKAGALNKEAMEADDGWSSCESSLFPTLAQTFGWLTFKGFIFLFKEYLLLVK